MVPISSNAQTPTKATRIKNNQGHMTPPEKTNETSKTDIKKMKSCELSKEEFRIILLKKLSEIQENTKEQLKEIRKDCMNKMSSTKE